MGTAVRLIGHIPRVFVCGQRLVFEKSINLSVELQNYDVNLKEVPNRTALAAVDESTFQGLYGERQNLKTCSLRKRQAKLLGHANLSVDFVLGPALPVYVLSSGCLQPKKFNLPPHSTIGA